MSPRFSEEEQAQRSDDQATRDQLTGIEDQLQLGPTKCSVIKQEAIKVKVDTGAFECLTPTTHR